MMSDPLFGWDLTFKTIEKDVSKKADIVVAFTHFNLVKRGFRCIGVGDERSLSGDESGSELLPAGWNDGQQFTLRYLLDGKLYILNGLITDGNIIMNLMKSEDLAVSNLALNVDNTVKEMGGSIEKLIPEYKEIMHKLKRDLIDTVCNKTTSSSETQTGGAEPVPPTGLDRPRRSLDNPLLEPRPGPARPDWPQVDPFQIGRSDLDPFASGGGMIYDPFSPNRTNVPGNPGLGIPGGLPRGSVPPGARFDPFAPPGVLPPFGRRPPPPDSDHFPPPGSHDMFM